MAVPDYYAALGIERDAAQEEIKKAYRRLARKYHPDVSKEPAAGERMAAVNEAYAVLSDPDKRRIYDAVGHHAWAQGARHPSDVRPAPDRSGGFTRSTGASDFESRHTGSSFDSGYSDFFEQFFGRHARGATWRGEAGRAWPGEDQHAEITLSLEEAYRGTERSLTLKSLDVDGAGNVVPTQRTLKVKIPPGVAQGQLIRLAGQGSPGRGGGQPGDLFLKVHIRAENKVRVSNRDVYMHLLLTPWEAALGASVSIATPAGPLAVAVPAGSTAGRRLRLRGKGIPGREPGDLFVELDIAVPGAVTPEQRAAWEALARTYPNFQPRPTASGNR